MGVEVEVAGVAMADVVDRRVAILVVREDRDDSTVHTFLLKIHKEEKYV